MFWTLPMPGLMRGIQAMTYNAFLDHITSVADAAIAGDQNAFALGDGLIRVHTLSKNGDMVGTVWGAHVFYEAAYNRIVQHGLPSGTIFDQQIDNSAQVLCMRETVAMQANFSGITRNGYTSNSYTYAPGLQARICTRLIYWDFAQEAAFEMNPYAMSGPSVYIPS